MIATEHPDRIAERHFLADKSLVLYLPLWKRDGSWFPSDDVYNRPCTVVGALWSPSGRRFDGVDDYITLADPADGTLDFGIGDFAIEAWCKITTGHLLNKYQGGVAGYYMLYAGVSFALYQTVGGTVHAFAPVGITIANNTWRHTVGIRDGNKIRLYVDGVAGVDADVSGYNVSNTTGIIMGHRLEADWLTGTAGEIRIYNRKLSVLEIQRNYELTKWRYL